MAVVVAGNFGKENVFQKVSRAFAPVKKGKNKSFVKAKIFQKETQVKIFNKETDQNPFGFSYKGL